MTYGVSHLEYNDFFDEVRVAVQAAEEKGSVAAWKILLINLKAKIEAFCFLLDRGRAESTQSENAEELYLFADLLGKVDIEPEVLPQLARMVGALYDMSSGHHRRRTTRYPMGREERVNYALELLIGRLTARLQDPVANQQKDS